MIWDHEIAGSNPAFQTFIRVWESPGIRLAWNQEIDGSNPSTLTYCGGLVIEASTLVLQTSRRSSSLLASTNYRRWGRMDEARVS